MENWGLITYRETAVLYTEGINPATSKQRVAVVVAHELAHQVHMGQGACGRDGGPHNVYSEMKPLARTNTIKMVS